MKTHHYLILTWLFSCPPPLAAQENFDIVVKDRAVVQRCITSDNARDIAVGMPGRFNFIFDPIRCRLDTIWFGGFLDFRAEATSRGGRRVAILGAKQSVGSDRVPIRITDAERMPESVDFRGYQKDSVTGIPTFLFAIDGVNVEQRVLSFGPNQVAIELGFPDSGTAKRFYRMDPSTVKSVAVSDGLIVRDAGVIEIPASERWAQIRVTLNPSKEKFVRSEPTTNGRLLYAMHCMSCHTLDGKKKIGPSFSSLWTSKRTIIQGTKTQTIEADEKYIRESILEPQAWIVEGYENANKMVDIRKSLNEKQIEALVQFILDLKDSNQSE